ADTRQNGTVWRQGHLAHQAPAQPGLAFFLARGQIPEPQDLVGIALEVFLRRDQGLASVREYKANDRILDSGQTRQRLAGGRVPPIDRIAGVDADRCQDPAVWGKLDIIEAARTDRADELASFNVPNGNGGFARQGTPFAIK